MADKSKRGLSEPAEQDDAVQSFIDELSEEPSGNHVIHGMVKPSDGNDGLMYALPGQCDHWIFLPRSAIQTIRRSGRVNCNGRLHTTATIQLKEPQSDGEKTFAGLASLHQASLLQLQRKLSLANALDPSCPTGTSWKQDQWGNWGCWP